MKKSTLLFLFLCSIPLQSASPAASASWLQQVRQNVTPSGETIPEETKQKIAPIMKSITKEISWKKVAALIAVSALGLVAYNLMFGTDLTNAIAKRWQFGHQHVRQPHVPSSVSSTEEEVKHKGQAATQSAQVYHAGPSAQQRREMLEKFLPKVVTDIIVSYLPKLPQEEEYKFYKTIGKSPYYSYVLQGLFGLNNNGTLGVNWLNSDDDQNSLRIWDVMKERIRYSLYDTDANENVRKTFLAAYFKNDKIRVVSTQWADNTVTIKDINVEQKTDQFNAAEGNTIVTFESPGIDKEFSIEYACISGNGETIATKDSYGRIYIGQIPLKPVVGQIAYTKMLNLHQYKELFIALNEEGTQAVIAGTGDKVSLWDITKQVPTKRDLGLKRTNRDYRQQKKDFSFNRYGDRVAIAGLRLEQSFFESPKVVYLVDTLSQQIVANLGPSPFVVYNHAGSLIATADANIVRLWNEDGVLFQTLPARGSSRVLYATFSGDDHTLAIVDQFNVHIWKTKTAIEKMKKRAASE